MKNKAFPIFIIFIALLLLPSFTDHSASSIAFRPKKIRVLSYNVKNCQGMDGIVDYTRIAAIINRINPDVVALQELDSATKRSNGVVVLDELARLTGMHRTYGASIDYQGGKYGVGILTKKKPESWRRIPLPGREEPRSLLIVELKDIVIGCTHFSLTQDDRIASANIVSEAFGEDSRPVIIAGDFNAVPESPVMKVIGESWDFLTDTSVPTSPSDEPGRCIDYIMGLHSDDFFFFTRRSVVELEQVASDHLPVWADILIRSNY